MNAIKRALWRHRKKTMSAASDYNAGTLLYGHVWWVGHWNRSLAERWQISIYVFPCRSAFISSSDSLRFSRHLSSKCHFFFTSRQLVWCVMALLLQPLRLPVFLSPPPPPAQEYNPSIYDRLRHKKNNNSLGTYGHCALLLRSPYFPPPGLWSPRLLWRRSCSD